MPITWPLVEMESFYFASQSITYTQNPLRIQGITSDSLRTSGNPTLYLFHFLFLAVLGLQCCADFSLALADEGYSLVAACGVLIVVASLIVE